MRTARSVVLAGIITVLTTSALSAQMGSPNTTPGAVVRVIHIRIKPGHNDAFWQDVRQGIITDYIVSTKATTEGPDDWNVGLQLIYPNYAALDNLASRTDPITLAHYGSAEKRSAANTARAEHATTIQSFLTRRQTVNPWK
jgi:hypothetical protein